MSKAYLSEYEKIFLLHGVQVNKFNKLIIEAMGGSGDNDLEKENKIIKKIAKNVIIDKNIEIN